MQKHYHQRKEIATNDRDGYPFDNGEEADVFRELETFAEVVGTGLAPVVAVDVVEVQYKKPLKSFFVPLNYHQGRG